MNELAGVFEEMGFDPKRGQLPEGAMIYALARTYNLVMRRLAAVYQRFGLSAASFNLLVLLQRGKDPDTFTQHAISERLVVSPSDMTGLIDRLERKGLVRRSAGKDRRTNLLRITPRGSALVDEAWPAHAQEIRRLCRGLRSDEATTLARVLARMRTPAAA